MPVDTNTGELEKVRNDPNFYRLDPAVRREVWGQIDPHFKSLNQSIQDEVIKQEQADFSKRRAAPAQPGAITQPVAAHAPTRIPEGMPPKSSLPSLSTPEAMETEAKQLDALNDQVIKSAAEIDAEAKRLAPQEAGFKQKWGSLTKEAEAIKSAQKEIYGTHTNLDLLEAAIRTAESQGLDASQLVEQYNVAVAPFNEALEKFKSQATAFDVRMEQRNEAVKKLQGTQSTLNAKLQAHNELIKQAKTRIDAYNQQVKANRSAIYHTAPTPTSKPSAAQEAFQPGAGGEFAAMAPAGAAFADQLKKRWGSILTPDEIEAIQKGLAIDPTRVEEIATELEKEPDKEIPMMGFGEGGMTGGYSTGKERAEAERWEGIVGRAMIDTLSQWYSPSMLLFQYASKWANLPEWKYAKLTEENRQLLPKAEALWNKWKSLLKAGNSVEAKEVLDAYNATAEEIFGGTKKLQGTRDFVRWVRRLNAAVGTGFSYKYAAQGIKDFKEGKYTEVAADVMGAVGAMALGVVPMARPLPEAKLPNIPYDVELVEPKPEKPKLKGTAEPEQKALPGGVPREPPPSAAPARPSPSEPPPTGEVAPKELSPADISAVKGKIKSQLTKLSPEGRTAKLAQIRTEAQADLDKYTKEGNVKGAFQARVTLAAAQASEKEGGRKRPGAKEKPPASEKPQTPETSLKTPNAEAPGGQISTQAPEVPLGTPPLKTAPSEFPPVAAPPSAAPAPPPDERRLDKATRMEVEDFMKKFPPGYMTRGEALQAVLDARKEVEAKGKAAGAEGTRPSERPPRTDQIGSGYVPPPPEPSLDLQGFDSDRTPMQQAKIREALTKNLVNRDRVISRKALVEEKVSSGSKVEVSKGGERRLIAPDGSFLAESQISKTAMDYAEHLAKKSEPTAKPPSPAAQPEGGEVAPPRAAPAQTRIPAGIPPTGAPATTAETESTLSPFGVDVQVKFPPSQEARVGLAKASQNPILKKQFKRLGITGFSIEEPYKFGLSEQGNIERGTGVIRLNAIADNPERTLAHELAHDIYERLDPQVQARMRDYIEANNIEAQHAGGMEERIADYFADVMTGNVKAPSGISDTFLSSPLKPRDKKSKPEREADTPDPIPVVRSWDEIRKRGGNITDTDDLAAIAKKYGEQAVVIQDVNGGRTMIPASAAAKVLATNASGYVREVFLPAWSVKTDRSGYVISVDRPAKGEIDPKTVQIDTNIPELKKAVEKAVAALPTASPGAEPARMPEGMPPAGAEPPLTDAQRLRERITKLENIISRESRRNHSTKVYEDELGRLREQLKAAGPPRPGQSTLYSGLGPLENIVPMAQKYVDDLKKTGTSLPLRIKIGVAMTKARYHSTFDIDRFLKYKKEFGGDMVAAFRRLASARSYGAFFRPYWEHYGGGNKLTEDELKRVGRIYMHYRKQDMISRGIPATDYPDATPADIEWAKNTHIKRFMDFYKDHIYPMVEADHREAGVEYMSGAEIYFPAVLRRKDDTGEVEYSPVLMPFGLPKTANARKAMGVIPEGWELELNPLVALDQNVKRNAELAGKRALVAQLHRERRTLLVTEAKFILSAIKEGEDKPLNKAILSANLDEKQAARVRALKGTPGLNVAAVAKAVLGGSTVQTWLGVPMKDSEELHDAQTVKRAFLNLEKALREIKKNEEISELISERLRMEAYQQFFDKHRKELAKVLLHPPEEVQHFVPAELGYEYNDLIFPKWRKTDGIITKAMQGDTRALEELEKSDGKSVLGALRNFAIGARLASPAPIIMHANRIIGLSLRLVQQNQTEPARKLLASIPMLNRVFAGLEIWNISKTPEGLEMAKMLAKIGAARPDFEKRSSDSFQKVIDDWSHASGITATALAGAIYGGIHGAALGGGLGGALGAGAGAIVGGLTPYIARLFLYILKIPKEGILGFGGLDLDARVHAALFLKGWHAAHGVSPPTVEEYGTFVTQYYGNYIRGTQTAAIRFLRDAGALVWAGFHIGAIPTELAGAYAGSLRLPRRRPPELPPPGGGGGIPNEPPPSAGAAPDELPPWRPGYEQTLWQRLQVIMLGIPSAILGGMAANWMLSKFFRGKGKWPHEYGPAQQDLLHIPVGKNSEVTSPFSTFIPEAMRPYRITGVEGMVEEAFQLQDDPDAYISSASRAWANTVLQESFQSPIWKPPFVAIFGQEPYIRSDHTGTSAWKMGSAGVEVGVSQPWANIKAALMNTFTIWQAVAPGPSGYGKFKDSMAQKVLNAFGGSGRLVDMQENDVATQGARYAAVAEEARGVAIRAFNLPEDERRDLYEKRVKHINPELRPFFSRSFADHLGKLFYGQYLNSGRKTGLPEDAKSKVFYVEMKRYVDNAEKIRLNHTLSLWDKKKAWLANDEAMTKSADIFFADMDRLDKRSKLIEKKNSPPVGIPNPFHDLMDRLSIGPPGGRL